MNPICSLGIDMGSTTAKIVGVDAEGKIVWHLLEQTDPRVADQVERFLEHARQMTGGVNGIPLVATGYGRKMVRHADRAVTEISCHAQGVFRALGHGGTLVDIGGQDSKVIAISPQGKEIDFVMNDKCAAGTGRFLENTAARLRVPLERMGAEALSANDEVQISSTCTVFAESEIISLVAEGVAVPSTLRGLHRSLIKRIVAMIRTVGLASPLMLSGGVVQNPAIRYVLEEETDEQVILPLHPQLMGAYGAALLAMKTY